MVDEIKDILGNTVKLETNEMNDQRYVDVELSYFCKDQTEIDRIVTAINNFVKANKEGLTRQNINILGYSMY